MQLDEGKSTPCINELPALVAPELHLQGQSDDSLVRPSPANSFPGLCNIINSLPLTAQARPPPAQSVSERWCQYVKEAHNFSMNNVDPKALAKAHQRLTSMLQSGKSPYSQMTRFEELLLEFINRRRLSPVFRSPAITKSITMSLELSCRTCAFWIWIWNGRRQTTTSHHSSNWAWEHAALT
jgi:hypothetical protein